LQEKKYPLETLDWFIGLEVTGAQLHGLLTSFGRTLKDLSLDFTTAGRFLREFSFRPCTSFPSAMFYQKMDTLSLRSFKGSLGFILQIPALKTLSLSKARNLDVMFPETDFLPRTTYPSLLKLHVDQHNPKDSVTSATLSRIGTVFNNLRVLDIRFLSDATLRAIFNSMPALEKLIALDGLFTDSGITGLPEPALDAVIRNKHGIPPKGFARHRGRGTHYIGTLKSSQKANLII
jgi:hypothetical protein